MGPTLACASVDRAGRGSIYYAVASAAVLVIFIAGSACLILQGVALPAPTSICASFAERNTTGTQSHPDVYRPSTLEPDRNVCDCGNNTREARRRGCVYDALAAAWLPPYCRDAELTDEFNRSGPGPGGSWAYFADEEGRTPISEDEMAKSGDTEGAFWCTREWHVAHCMFYWQKYTRMRDTGVIMERRFDGVAHVRHCRRLVMNSRPDRPVLIRVNVQMNSRLVEPEVS